MKTEQLKHMLDNPKGYLFAVDLDGTITLDCCTTLEEMLLARPNQKMLDNMLRWYLAGAHIVIYTARPPKFYRQTLAWLINYSVPFHGICMQFKPHADVYIDDHALNVNDV